jgi:signal transduction histidine kinase/CheY-like chemotaxis protein
MNTQHSMDTQPSNKIARDAKTFKSKTFAAFVLAAIFSALLVFALPCATCAYAQDSAAKTSTASTASTSTTANSNSASSNANSTSSSTTSTSTTSENIQIVRVGWFQSDLFQEGTSDDEQKSGYAYDYLRKLSNYTNWKYEYVYGDWSELYEMLCRGEIDLMAGMSMTDERKSLMLFPNSAMETDEYYIYKRADDSSIKSSDTASFEGKKIGLLHNNRISDFAEDWVNENNINAEIIYFDSFDVLHEAFNNGEIDLEPRTSDGASDSSALTPVVKLGEEASYVAVNKQKPSLLDELNEAINCMNSADPYALQEIQRNNYGSVYVSKALTSDEISWLNSHNVVTIGYIDNYLPYCGTDSNGNATGLVTDVTNAVFNSLDTDSTPNISYKAYESYQDLVDAIHACEIDLAFPISTTTWQLEQDEICASSNVITDRGALFYKSVYEKYDVKTIAVKEGNLYQVEYTKLSYPNAEIKTYMMIDDCLEAVLNGEVDGTIMDALRIQYVTNQSKYEGLSYIQLNVTTGKSFGIAQGNKGLLMLVDRGLKLIGTTYGYDNSYKYLDAFESYEVVDFAKSHMLEITVALICLAAIIAITLTMYIRKQRRQIALQEQLKREAEAANVAKSNFLFNMSHDIRTPMNAVLGFTELMQENINDPDKLESYIEKSKFSGEYLLGLINNVLEVARIDSGRETLNEEITNLEDEGYYYVFENDVSKKHLNVTRYINIEHAYVYADAQKIKEIILNLVSNAIKYTPDGGTIRINLEEHTCDTTGYANYSCSVSDTGIGMTKEFQEHIFDSFARERNTTESKIMGTGLGMAIVKKLTDIMGGTIAVESEPGKGSTFTVSMNLRIVENPEEYLKNKQHEENKENIDLSGKTLLVAEDNELNAEIAKAVLENLGASVEVAKDGVECIDMLQNHAAGYYDLVLMDIQMPNLNGYGAAKKIRSLPDSAKANIPIVAMTANAFDEDKRNAFAAGMNGHIAKPINMKEINRVLGRVLGNAQ